ncbi:MAG: hypothetical protein ACRDK4_00335 [Solirubrobacteraceae bacterium]
MMVSRAVRRALVCVVLAVLASALGASSALALQPWWTVEAGTAPAVLPSAKHTSGALDGYLVVSVANLGDADMNSEGAPVRISDVLPAGLIAKRASGVAGPVNKLGESNLGRAPVVCGVESTHSVSCTFEGVLPPYETIEVRIGVLVDGAQSGEVNEVSLSGGNARPPLPARTPITVGGENTFGAQRVAMSSEEEGGGPDLQAGSHPFQLTTTVRLNEGMEPDNVPALTKDVNVRLPPGLVGNPTPFPQCSEGQFTTSLNFVNHCPNDTAVGVASVDVYNGTLGHQVTVVPLFNLAPSHGEPARFGFEAYDVPVYLDAAVAAGGNYSVTVSASHISQEATFLASRVTFWGVPGDPRHDSARGWSCISDQGQSQKLSYVPPCAPLAQASPPPLLSLPTSCKGPLLGTAEIDSWLQPGDFQSYPISMPGLDGCNRLPFSAQLSVAPDVPNASSSSGLTVDVHVPQQLVTNAGALAESTLKDTTVALPSGVAVNPSGGDGLVSCGEGEVGFTGVEEGGVGRDLFTAGLPSPFCPDSSKIGTVKITTPLLPNPLEGAVYLAAQNQNPFGSLLAMYMVAEDPVSGTLIKLAGEVALDPVTGQLVSTFKNTPELPFEDLVLHFFGGERAPLATPARCGSYTTTASLSPWSGNPPSTPSSTFQIVSGPRTSAYPNGSPCPGASLPFTPRLTGGAVNNNGGALSPLSTTIGREDGEQNMQSVTLHMPSGLSGLLSGVALCGEAQANAGTCGPESLIGETTVSAGVGSDPVSVTGGRVYITEKYGSAPFGLSIVNPVKAGPFDLEHDTSRPSEYMPACDCVVVRAKIEVDPITAALTVTTDASGPHAIPHMIDGVPVQIKRVNVLINRPGFTFNPTDCAPLGITGSIASDEGAVSPVSVPFQVANCANLAFKPSFKVSTSGKTSRRTGASLHINLAYPKAPFGSQANIRSVKVDLPKQLPSNLKTLQKACTAAQFQDNPAVCPSASRVGTARAITPLLPVALEGPAYFVSHGGAQFPELIIVLQGYGVTLDLHGETFINEKTNITSSTFHTVPDAPVGSFELTLPQGPFSALAAPGGLCSITKTVLVKKKVTVRSKGRTRTVTRRVKATVAAPLLMPTLFTAQNGAVIKQNTPISVTGCAKARKAGPARRHRLGRR